MAAKDTTPTAIERIEAEGLDEAGNEDRRRAAALAVESDKGAGYLLNFRLFGSICSISLAAVTAYWGFTPPASVLTFIAKDIGDGGGNDALFSIIWTMCAALMMLLLGRLSDKFGRRYFVLGASATATVGAIIASTAQSMNTLIGANVLLGLAAGVQSSYALLVGEIVPNKYKWLGITLVIIPSFLPTGFGAYLARRLVETSTWRWIYYIQIILMVCCFVLQFIFYKPPNFQQLHGDRSLREELKRVDYIGIFLLVAGMSTFLLGVSWGGQPDPWTSPKILCLVIIGGCLLVALAFWDLYSGTPNPIVPFRVWKDLRGFTSLACIAGCAGAMYVATTIIWPAQVIEVYSLEIDNWEEQAWMSTTISFGLAGGMLFFGSLFHIIKHVRYQLIFKTVVSTAFLGALASCDRNSMASAIAFSTIGTFPVGSMEITPQVLIQMDSPDADIGAVYAFLHCFRTAMGAVMTAVFLAIQNSKVPGNIDSMVPPAALAAGLPESSLADLSTAVHGEGISALPNVPGMTDSIELAVKVALSDAYSASYAYVYYSVIAIGGIAIIAAFTMKDYDDKLNNHVSKRIYHGKRELLETEEKETSVESGKDSA